jgi:alkylhydroperoxidase family enzyme
MARVPYLQQSDLSETDRDLLARDINLNRALVNSPNGARAFSRLGGFIRNRSRLDPRLREMAILQVGYVARSPYEYSHHIKIGREFGVSDDDIRAIAAETSGKPTALGGLERAVLAAARQMAGGLPVEDATFTDLKASLDNELLVDLVITISFYCGVVRLLETLHIEVEPEYVAYLDEFPLPG